MILTFELRRTCLVPDGTQPVDGEHNHFRLPSGRILSILAIVELESADGADDHRDLTYDECARRGLFLELVERDTSLEGAMPPAGRL